WSRRDFRNLGDFGSLRPGSLIDNQSHRLGRVRRRTRLALPMSVPESIGRGPRLHGSNLIAHISTGPGPVDEAVLLCELGCFRGLSLVLLDPLDGTGGDLVDHLEGQSRADLGQAGFQFSGRLVGADVNGLLRQHVTGVKGDRHANDGYARPSFAVIDGPSHGGGATIFREEGSM